ncbi:MAG TPA: DNA-3-methyladenine glycosylase [Candidatus Acidoferrales bacterium]|nr:DNA-3-methyladenine glycosylase [Candidatus Acidoferrales bacterium]
MTYTKPSAKLQKPIVSRHIAGKGLLPPEFYVRNVKEVAPDLLGKLLVRREGKQVRSARIVEVEAYLGLEDPAAHAYRGPTARNQVLFGPPGRAYVYFIYGFHYCLNISCEPEGKAGCILIRALEPVEGLELMYAARDLEREHGRVTELRLLTSGPGRLAEAFSITRERDNGKDVTSRRSDLQVFEDGFRPEKVAITVRIGITKAAEEPLRYLIAGNPFVSGKRVV